MFSSKVSVLAAILVIFSCPGVFGESVAQAPLLDQFDTLFRELSDKRGERTERIRQLDSRLEELMETADGDHVALFQNFALFLNARRLTEAEGYLMMVVTGRLQERFNVSTDEIIRAALPLTRAVGLPERMAGFFCLSVATRDGQELAPLREYLAARGARGYELPATLIDFMFQSDPSSGLSAMLTLPTIPESRSIALKEITQNLDSGMEFGVTSRLHRNADEDVPLLTLVEMANAPEWWVRLGAAESMRKIPALQSKAVVDKLRSDEHDSVRASIKGIDQWNADTPPPQFRIFLETRAEAETGDDGN